jgi:hypothetical protein
MAREQNGSTNRTDDGTIDRRSYLKLAGVATATVAAGTAAASQSSSRTLGVSDGERIDSYLEGIGDGETVTIPEGTYTFSGATISADDVTIKGDGATLVSHGANRLNIRGSNWEFGGVTFDQTGDSNQVMIFPSGSGWRLHSCAWVGELSAGNYLIYPELTEGSQAEIDRCWFGDGVSDDRSESAIVGFGAIHGELWIRRSYFYQNGVYGLDTAHMPDMQGTINFDRNYFENCYLSCMRAGNAYGKTARIKDCVVLYDSRAETPAVQSTGQKAFRGIWAFWGEVTVEDTDVTNPFGPALVTSSNHGSPSITMTGGNLSGSVVGNVTVADDVGNDPSTTPPDECVTSAAEAVAINGGGAPTTEPEPDGVLFELVASDDAQSAAYQFAVDGNVSKHTTGDNAADANDEITENSDGTVGVAGVAGNGYGDAYYVDGEVTELDLDPAKWTLYWDGGEVARDDLVTDTPNDGTSELPHTLSIVAETDDVVNYEFTVTEQARKSTARDASKNPNDQIDDGVVTGSIAGGVDSYEFDGKISSFSIDGNATVYLDDGQVAPSDLNDGSKYSGKLVLDGTAHPRRASTYEFTVDGDVRKSGMLGSLNPFDSISGNTVSGRVVNGKDGYSISGEIVSFNIDGRATINYEEE